MLCPVHLTKKMKLSRARWVPRASKPWLVKWRAQPSGWHFINWKIWGQVYWHQKHLPMHYRIMHGPYLRLKKLNAELIKIRAWMPLIRTRSTEDTRIVNVLPCSTSTFTTEAIASNWSKCWASNTHRRETWLKWTRSTKAADTSTRECTPISTIP